MSPSKSLYRTLVAHDRIRVWCERRLAEQFPHSLRRTVPTSLGPTHLTTWGTGADHVLVLPGTNFNAATSLGWATALSTRWTVTVADLPGQPGLSSPRRPSGDLVRVHRTWLDEVVAAIGGRPVVVGESLGATVALCADPASVAGLVLVAPGGITSAALSAGLMRVTLPWMLRPTDPRSARLLGFMSGPAAPPVEPSLVEWMTLVARSARSSLAPRPLAGAVLAGWRDVPCAVLVGSADCFFPSAAVAERVGRHVGASVRVVEGAGHLLAHEHPALLAEAVLSLT
jgi:pimeloyl-ACP methyl ester carboxylesterase